MFTVREFVRYSLTVVPVDILRFFFTTISYGAKSVSIITNAQDKIYKYTGQD